MKDVPIGPISGLIWTPAISGTRDVPTYMNVYILDGRRGTMDGFTGSTGGFFRRTEVLLVTMMAGDDNSMLL